MGMTLTPTGKQSLIDGTIDLDTNTIKVALVDLATADVAIKAVTAATNATRSSRTSATYGPSVTARRWPAPRVSAWRTSPTSSGRR